MESSFSSPSKSSLLKECLLMSTLSVIYDSFSYFLMASRICFSTSSSTKKYLREGIRSILISLFSYSSLLGEWPLREIDLRLLRPSIRVRSMMKIFLSSRSRVYIFPFSISAAEVTFLYCENFSPHSVQCLVNLLLNNSILDFVFTYSIIFSWFATEFPFSQRTLKLRYCSFIISSSGF